MADLDFPSTASFLDEDEKSFLRRLKGEPSTAYIIDSCSDGSGSVKRKNSLLSGTRAKTFRANTSTRRLVTGRYEIVQPTRNLTVQLTDC